VPRVRSPKAKPSVVFLSLIVGIALTAVGVVLDNPLALNTSPNPEEAPGFAFRSIFLWPSFHAAPYLEDWIHRSSGSPSQVLFLLTFFLVLNVLSFAIPVGVAISLARVVGSGDHPRVRAGLLFVILAAGAAIAFRRLRDDSVIHSLTPEELAAFHGLEKAKMFESAAVGVLAITPEETRSFRLLLASPVAKPAFQVLLHRGSIAGQLYALSGEYLLDHERFERKAAFYRFLHARNRVKTMIGCIVSSSNVSELVDAGGRAQTWGAIQDVSSREWDLRHGVWPNILAGTPESARSTDDEVKRSSKAASK
jgi:hypothetical protein